MHKNGVLIKNLRSINYQSEKYFGTAKYFSEPLLSQKDELSQKLSDEIFYAVSHYYYHDENNVERYYLELIPEYSLYERYIKHCNDMQMPTEIFFIESNRPSPIWEGQDLETEFMGYEYVVSSLDDPMVICEIEMNDILIKHKNKLNKYGLFDDYETVNDFVNDYTAFMKEGLIYDDNMDFEIIKVSRVMK